MRASHTLVADLCRTRVGRSLRSGAFALVALFCMTSAGCNLLAADTDPNGADAGIDAADIDAADTGSSDVDVDADDPDVPDVAPDGSPDMDTDVFVPCDMDAIDCSNADCDALPECVGSENTSELCQDGVDNDSDQRVDCDDPDCRAFEFCTETTLSSCTDEVDNDGDELVDCEDEGCVGVCFCAADEYVDLGECITCPDGTTNEEGDAIVDPDTVCDPTLCSEYERVASHVCVPCQADEYNVAGDDASLGDTTCNRDVCSVLFGLSCDAFDEAYVKASNTGRHDRFGNSVALSADGLTLAVGSRYEDSAGVGVDAEQGNDSSDDADAGAVYVFARVDGVWSQRAYLKASNTDELDHFGTHVALSADGLTLAVGAPDEASALTGIDPEQDDNSAPGAGAVYVFTLDADDTWAQQAYIKASNAGEADQFGTQVSLSADGLTLVVGAPGEASNAIGVAATEQDDDTAPDAGAVYVFEREPMGAWTQETYIKATNAQEGDGFGGALALSGDGGTLVVGAAGEDSEAERLNGNQGNNVESSSGAVYVFIRDADSWDQHAYVKASNTNAGDAFGSCVALSHDGRTLAIGAPNEGSSSIGVNNDAGDNEAEGAGAVYVFARGTNNRWTQQAYIKASNTGAGDLFGRTVAVSGDGSMLLVGASHEDSAASNLNGTEADNTALNSGALYLFRRDSLDVWAQQVYIKPSNGGHQDEFGAAVAFSSDGTVFAAGATHEGSDATGVDGEGNNNLLQWAGAVYLRRLGDRR